MEKLSQGRKYLRACFPNATSLKTYQHFLQKSPLQVNSNIMLNWYSPMDSQANGQILDHQIKAESTGQN